MAGRIRNTNWQEDEKLKQDLRAYVAEGLKREEILDFVNWILFIRSIHGVLELLIND